MAWLSGLRSRQDHAQKTNAFVRTTSVAGRNITQGCVDEATCLQEVLVGFRDSVC
jgi:hypothetical protein